MYSILIILLLQLLKLNLILEHTCLQLYLANIIIAKCQCLPDYMDDMAQELEKYDLRKEK